MVHRFHYVFDGVRGGMAIEEAGEAAVLVGRMRTAEAESLARRIEAHIMAVTTDELRFERDELKLLWRALRAAEITGLSGLERLRRHLQRLHQDGFLD